MSSGQRKRRGGALNSRRPQKQMRLMAATSAGASEAEPRELGESASEEVLDLPGPSSKPAVIHGTLIDSDETDEEEAPEEVGDPTSESSGPEVIDLTRESSGPEVIDLTQDDSDETDEEEAPEEVGDPTSESSGPEVIYLIYSDETDEEEAPEEVGDPTSESSGPEVIYLIYSDETEEDESESSDSEDVLVIHSVSVVMPAEENQQERGNLGPRGRLDIASPRRDDPDEPRHNDVPPGTIKCPVCMDFYSEIMQSGRQIVSTTCGHVFCNRCLYNCLMNSSFCPTCRADIDGQYHPLYI